MSKAIFFNEHLKKVSIPKGQKIFWRVSSYVLVKNKNKILMEVPTWHDLWELPGGSVEKDESLIDAAIRECYEETGYKIKIENSQPIFTGEQFFKSEYLNKYFHSIIVVFNGILLSEKQDSHVINTMHESVGKRDEISKVDWIDSKSLIKKNCHPNFYHLINNLVNKRGISAYTSDNTVH